MFDGDILDFLGQLPPIVPIAFCGFLLLLAVSLILLVNMSLRKRRTQDPHPAPGKVPTLIPEFAVQHDLPDLDLLIGAEPSPGIPLPAASPMPVASAAPQISPARKSGTYWLALSDGRRVEAADVLTISRDLADGALIVQIGAQAYGHAADITDAEARRRLKGALRELAQQVTEAPREARTSTAEVPAVAPPSPETARFEPPAPRPTPSAPTPTVAGEWDLPNFNEMANEPLKLRGGKPKQAVPEINIAAAIEAYLQHKLRQTPAFEHRRLHIHGAPGGGVRIEVDGRFYEAVSDIEDVDTRTFMAQAIEEWQSRQ